jgi:hypothetical protein
LSPDARAARPYHTAFGKRDNQDDNQSDHPRSGKEGAARQKAISSLVFIALVPGRLSGHNDANNTLNHGREPYCHV